MFNAIMQRLWPWTQPVDLPPQRRPKKYPRTTDVSSSFPHPNGQVEDPRGMFQQPGYPQARYIQHPEHHASFPAQNNMYYYPPAIAPQMMNNPYHPAGFQPFYGVPGTHWPVNPPPFSLAPGHSLPHFPVAGQVIIPGSSGPLPHAPVVAPSGAPPVLPVSPALKPENQPPSVKIEGIGHDHSNSPAQDWPTGFVRIERVKGTEERKWKQNKWVWHSNGTVERNGFRAEVRSCMGVFRCASCGRLTRPKTNAAARKEQRRSRCTSRTCSPDAVLVHDSCEARAFHFNYEHDGETILVWEHSGDHSTHGRPPGGALSKGEEDQVDAQVLRRQDATAHELRTGDIGSGSVPFADISATLANANAGRYALAQSQSRLGLTATKFKGGLGIFAWFADLAKRLPTPWVADCCLSGPVYISFQTPFMDDIIRECVESWLLDLEEGPSAAQHGIVLDGDHSYFLEGPLLASCAYSMTSNEWVPIYYSWINGQDMSHHRPHFASIFKSIIKHAGSRFTRNLLLCVMDFSAAQRGAHAEEYADAVISTMPGFNSLSLEAQAAERRQLVLEASENEIGCELHFWRSGDRIKKNHSLVPPELAHIWENGLRELLSPKTTPERFDTVIAMLKTTFPATKNWISWWERPTVASMIFPAKSVVDRDLAAKAPSTTNPIEHQHSLLHHAVGKHHELQPGVENLYLHAREMQKKHTAIKDGHFNATDIRGHRPPKSRPFDENDGRAPDTVTALAALDQPATQSPAAPAAGTVPPPPPAITYSQQMLQSYPWSAPNSCFFDNGMEIWFRAFVRWSPRERANFLAAVPQNSALATFFGHFNRRLKWIEASGTARAGAQELGLGQSLARYAIFNKWKLYQDPNDYGCASTWLFHAIRDSGTSDDVRLQFGVSHLISGNCSAQHLSQTAVGSIQTLLAINRFDLRTTRAKTGPGASLTDYFAHCTPRIPMGNEDGGTTVVHSLPPPTCGHSDCSSSTSVSIETISTLWPRILHINPDSGIEARLPISRSFTVDNGANSLVEYELIGTVSFVAREKHWTSKILVDNTTFFYNDLVNNGSLVPQGPAELISEVDPRAALWVYHRTSTVAKSVKSLRDIIPAYEAAFIIDSSRVRSPPLSIDGSPSPRPSPLLDPATHGISASVAKAVPASEPVAPFPTIDPIAPVGAVYPEVPPPSEWCSGCHQICNHNSDESPATKCAECGYWRHIKCVKDADRYADIVLDGWLCNNCDGVQGGEPVWNDALLGTYLMFQLRPQSTFYPARLTGLTSTGDVHVEWYEDNVYERGERPLQRSGFDVTKQQCAAIAAIDVDLIDDCGVIRWPLRLTEDARQIHRYQHAEISEALRSSRQTILGIIIGSHPGSHPIIQDYTQWMAKAPELKQSKHAEEFGYKFSSAAILPGDISLIEPHAEFVFERIPAADRSSEPLRLRATTLVPLLFHLVILRTYLQRSSADDCEIYFLTRHFNHAELKQISADDFHFAAKTGTITRHLTIPEIVINTPEGAIIDPRWCKIGTTLSRAADARIPSQFLLASAYDRDGIDYVWTSSAVIGTLANPQQDHFFHPSSPLSDSFSATLISPDFNRSTTSKIGGVDTATPTKLTSKPPHALKPTKHLKRKRGDVDDDDFQLETEAPAPPLMGTEAVGLRRSTRTRKG